MVTAITLAALLAWTPDPAKFSGTLLNAAEPAPLKLAVPNLKAADVAPAKAEFFTQHLATELGKARLQVTTAADIQAVLGMERQRQMLGCGESDKCMTEIANALGTDGIVSGTIAKLGEDLAVNVKVIDSVDGKTLAQYSADAPSEKAALDMLTLAAKDIAAQLQKLRAAQAQGPSATVAAAPAKKIVYERQNSPLRTFGKWTMITSGVLLGLAAVTLVSSLVIAGFEYSATGETPIGAFFLVLSVVEAIAVPGVFLIGLVSYFLGEERMVPVQAAVLPTRDGGVVAALAFRF